MTYRELTMLMFIFVLLAAHMIGATARAQVERYAPASLELDFMKLDERVKKLELRFIGVRCRAEPHLRECQPS